MTKYNPNTGLASIKSRCLANTVQASIGLRQLVIDLCHHLEAGGALPDVWAEAQALAADVRHDYLTWCHSATVEAHADDVVADNPDNIEDALEEFKGIPNGEGDLGDTFEPGDAENIILRAFARLPYLNEKAKTSPKAKAIPKLGVRVGDGVTYSVGGDRYPATVIKVSRTVILIQEDAHTITGGNFRDGNATCSFLRDAEGRVRKVTLRKDGSWKLSGGHHGFVTFGSRDYYQDPHF